MAVSTTKKTSKRKPVPERRSTVRAKRILSIEFRLKDGRRKAVDKRPHLSLTEDMSVGGLTFYSETQYRAGDILEVRVVMSGLLDIFKGPAKVVRAQKNPGSAVYLIAVQFVEETTRTSKKKPAKQSTVKINGVRTR